MEVENKKELSKFKRVPLKDKFNKTKHGVGFIGDGIYKSKLGRVNTVEYSYWDGMMRRCYSERVQKIDKSYVGCSVAEEWHNFQNFAKWFNENFNRVEMNLWCLDKDILVKGNRVYSPETCAFVPQNINVLFTNGYVKRGKYPKGVTFKPRINKYVAQYQNRGNVLHIGVYTTIEEAFNAYKITKEAYIKEIAEEWKDQIDERVYQAMYNYKVNITD